MAVKAHQIVVVSCPRSELTGNIKERKGVGKSCFCNRFVKSDAFSLHHSSVLNEKEWRRNSVYNEDHFIYWGAVTKKLSDGDTARFHIVEQTEFYNADDENTSFPAEEDYISRACSTQFVSRGKAAYKVHNEEEYAIPTSPKYKKSVSSQAIQLFPNNEFSEGKGITGFICLFDPTLQGEDIRLQFDFLSKLLQELVKARNTVILACTKCEEARDGLIQFGANFAATIIPKKSLPFVQTSAKEDVNIDDCFFQVVSLNKKKSFVKSSPTCLLPTYSEVMIDRATNTFNHVVKENVQQFSTEWSDIWPTLQRNEAIVQVVEVLGIEKARDIFCHRLIEIKINEVQATHPKARKLDQQQIGVLKEAFNGHPDLGTDFVNDLNFLTSPLSSSMRSKSSLSHFPISPTQYNGSNALITSSPFPPNSLPTPSPTVDHLDNTNFEISAGYHKKDDSLNEQNQTSAAFCTLREQHSCNTDHPYSSSPSSTISPYLTTYGATICTKSENHYYHVLVDEKANWVDATNRTATYTDGENSYYCIIHADDHEPSLLDVTYTEEESPYYSVIHADDHKPSFLAVNSEEGRATVVQIEQVTDLHKRKEEIEKELLSEIERVQRTLTLQLSDKDKEIDKLKQTLEEIRQRKTEDLTTYLYEKEDNLRGVIEAGDTFFILTGNSKPQFFTWKRYGLSLSAPAVILPLQETCKVAITALAGGDFEFPKGCELVSAIYAITISKPLLKPLTVNIQHCVALETQEQGTSLHFVRAPLNNGGPPYQFEVFPGGNFTSKSQYGSISCTQFSLIGVSLGGNWEGQGENGEGENGGPGQEENGEGENGGPGQGENGEGENGGGENGGPGQGENGEGENGGPGQEENGEGENGGPGEGENGGGVYAENGEGEEREEQGVCGGQEERGRNVGGAKGHQERAVFRRSHEHVDMLYFCKVYREKEATSLWRVMFTVVKDLEVLSEYIRKEHPNALEILKLDLKLSSQSYVEFDFKKNREKIPHGWEVNPLIDPTRLYRDFIDKFGKSKLPEPSSCPVVVRDKQQSNTERFFCYSVPVLLDDIPYIETSFYLYNTPQIAKAKECYDGATIIKVDQMITSDKVEEVDKVKKVIQKVLKKYFSNLEILLNECLQEIATAMFSNDLVSQNIKKEPNVAKMMSQFTSAQQGGPFKRASDKIAQEWTTNIEKELGVNLEFNIE